MRPRLVPYIRRVTAEDAQLLAELGERTFRDAFADQNTAENLQLYLAQAFGEEKQRAELSDRLPLATADSGADPRRTAAPRRHRPKSSGSTSADLSGEAA